MLLHVSMLAPFLLFSNILFLFIHLLMDIQLFSTGFSVSGLYKYLHMSLCGLLMSLLLGKMG